MRSWGNNLGKAAAALISVGILTSCSAGAEPAVNAISTSSPSAAATDQASSQIKGQSTVKDVKPTPEPGDPTGPLGGPAFEAKRSAPALVERGNAAVKSRVPAAEADFRKPARFKDGVSVSTEGFQHGTVEEEGAGIVQGAPYVVIEVTIRNSSKKPFDVSAVVPTMVYGDASTAAAPLYSGVDVQDLSGIIAPGQEQEARYAFQVPAEAASGALYLDLNGTHQPAVFSGDLP